MIERAPGGPGIPPTWTSSAKDMVGCALGASRLWFTLGFGIVNKVYYPRVDVPQIRDLGFIIADGEGFWAEVKRVANYRMRLLAPGVPAVEVVHEHERYTLRLRIAPSVRRDVLAIECRLDGDPKLRLYALLAPHLGATGYGNHAAVVMYRRRRTLWAEQGPFGATLWAVDGKQRDAIGRASAGYVGSSDGWQDFHCNGRMTWEYERAGPGNVALIAELPRSVVLALGFGSSAESAATLAIGSLLQPFDSLLQQHIAPWQAWHAERSERHAVPLDVPPALAEEYLVSTIVLRTHQDKTYPGAMVASLSIPWGDSGNEHGGYHLGWPRDLVETAGALLALGGRGWPLLTGERGHYELAAGRDPLPFLEAMARMASPGGMLPEQVWDADPIPSRRLAPGQPSGSAMPLVWAHAEFIKLMVSRHQGRRATAGHAFWWLHAPIREFHAGARLAIALPRPADVHWGRDGWRDAADEATRDSGLGFHVAVLDVAHLAPGERVDFTWRWQDSGMWQSRDYTVAPLPPGDAPASRSPDPGGHFPILNSRT